MIDVNTKKLGLIGYPLGHSISPLLHNSAFKQMALNYVYLAFQIKPEELVQGIKGIKALDIKGVNVTIPYKKKVMPFLKEIDDIAQKIGAVNTLVNKNGNFYGYNTDAYGFKKMLNQDGNFYIENKKALIIGAGGASRAVGIVLCENDIDELYIINRTEAKAKKLADEWKEKYAEVKITSGGLDKNFYNPFLKDMDLIVDTTSVGMEPKADVDPVIVADKFHSNMLVVDLVYNPPETTILKAAQKRGAETINGLNMLLYQAEKSFELWTGKSPDLENWFNLVKTEFLNEE
ncbi:MAG: shikimate dehydrogenase [bacterium]